MTLFELSRFATIVGGVIAGVITGVAESGFIAGAFGLIIGIAAGILAVMGSFVVMALILAATELTCNCDSDSPIQDTSIGFVFALTILTPFVAVFVAIAGTLKFIS